MIDCRGIGPTPMHAAAFSKEMSCLVPTQNPKKCYSSYHIEYLRLVYRALNVDEKKLITQFGGKLRDERFELN